MDKDQEEKLLLYWSGETRDRQEVETLLRTSAECRRYLRDLERIAAEYRQGMEAAPDRDLVGAALDRCEAEAARKILSPPVAWRTWAAAAALVFLLAYGGFQGWKRHDGILRVKDSGATAGSAPAEIAEDNVAIASDRLAGTLLRGESESQRRLRSVRSQVARLQERARRISPTY